MIIYSLNMFSIIIISILQMHVLFYLYSIHKLNIFIMNHYDTMNLLILLIL